MGLESETRKLYEKAEGELFKLRHSPYALSADGRQEPAEKLIAVLRGAVRPLSNHDLLKALGMDPRDLTAMKISVRSTPGAPRLWAGARNRPRLEVGRMRNLGKVPIRSEDPIIRFRQDLQLRGRHSGTLLTYTTRA